MLCILSAAMLTNAKTWTLTSPNGKLSVTITDGEHLTWAVNYDGSPVITPSALSMNCRDCRNGRVFTMGENAVVTRAKTENIATTIATPIYKRAQVDNHATQLTLTFRGGYSVVWRAYDDGAAYRFVSSISRPFYVLHETADFNFDNDYNATVPYMTDSGEKYCYSAEAFYDDTRLSALQPNKLIIAPAAISLPQGRRAVIMEAGLRNYPGMLLMRHPSRQNALTADFAPVPLKIKIGGWQNFIKLPTQRADYIYDPTCGPEKDKKTDGCRSFPWRVVLVTEKDTQLADNDMARRLGDPCAIKDPSWIKPGKVAWDWWNSCNLWGVDFRSGMNTATYKAFADFAAKNHLEYICIDEGWSTDESLLDSINPNIDVKAIVDYARAKGVGVILWTCWRNIADHDTERVMDHYSKMGVKGFKIDFFERDDQLAIVSAEELARCAARHHLVLDYHGFKAFGLENVYPNLLNSEGVKGLENTKFEPVTPNGPLHDFPRHDVIIPYLRTLIGPMDYTPGAMINATRQDFRAVYDHPMSMGTRTHQMAMYTLYEAPLQMLSDSPSRYEKEQECTDFIAQVPTTFDETVALSGQMGEYLCLARRKGDVWYLGAMTNWSPRDIEVPLSFLGNGNYTIDLFTDGVNADIEATDYKHTQQDVTADTRLRIHMAPGGGMTAKITRK